MGRIDWKTIRTEYITGIISYRQLSKNYGVSIAQIKKRGKEEQWVRSRREYIEKTVEQAVEKSVSTESERLAKLMTATEKMVDATLDTLEDNEQFNRYIVSEKRDDGCSETVERVFRKKDTRAMNDITKVLKECTALMRDFYNVPTPAEAEAQRIASEKLELEKKKAESGESGEYTVRIEGGGEELIG